MTGTQQLNGRVVTNNQEVLHGNGGNNGESFEHAQAWWKGESTSEAERSEVEWCGKRETDRES